MPVPRPEEATRPTEGLTPFYTDLDRSAITVNAIPKMGWAAVDSNALFIDDFFVPESHRIGAKATVGVASCTA